MIISKSHRTLENKIIAVYSVLYPYTHTITKDITINRVYAAAENFKIKPTVYGFISEVWELSIELRKYRIAKINGYSATR